MALERSSGLDVGASGRYRPRHRYFGLNDLDLLRKRSD
jgi:hypothetical protein